MICIRATRSSLTKKQKLHADTALRPFRGAFDVGKGQATAGVGETRRCNEQLKVKAWSLVNQVLAFRVSLRREALRNCQKQRSLDF
jgi:hypothetical protein